jgi:hypothetical protein
MSSNILRVRAGLSPEEMRPSITTNTPTPAHLEKFFSRVDPTRGRLIFALYATASREATWDRAAQLQAQMFETVAAIGGLDVQLVYFRGFGECVASRWFNNPKDLVKVMSGIMCRAGHTQIANVLKHTRKENAAKKMDALVLVSDACEEMPSDIYREATELGVRVFMFQEGDGPGIDVIYKEISRLTGGAHAAFDASSVSRLADLLRGAAVFAVGGTKALALQKSEAATLLLTQMKNKGR